jgi:flagellar motility protein MotE (MotC chaperone)
MVKTVEKERDEKTFSRLQWIFFAGIIPLLFAVIVTLIVMTFMGVNIFEKVSEIPVLSKVLPSEGKKNIEKFDKKIVNLQGQLKDKDAKITQLQSKIDNQEQEKEQLLRHEQDLKKQIDELKQIQEDNKRAFKEVVSTFEAMSAKSAAPVLIAMEEAEALKILSNIKPDSLAKILEKMPPEEAATFTESISIESESNEQVND